MQNVSEIIRKRESLESVTGRDRAIRTYSQNTYAGFARCWHLGTQNIEWSPGTYGDRCANFLRFSLPCSESSQLLFAQLQDIFVEPATPLRHETKPANLLNIERTYQLGDCSQLVEVDSCGNNVDLDYGSSVFRPFDSFNCAIEATFETGELIMSLGTGTVEAKYYLNALLSQKGSCLFRDRLRRSTVADNPCSIERDINTGVPTRVYNR
jgi:hypothetical protein